MTISKEQEQAILRVLGGKVPPVKKTVSFEEEILSDPKVDNDKKRRIQQVLHPENKQAIDIVRQGLRERKQKK